jgi:hypothetical protein
MSRKDPRRSIPLPAGPALRARLRAAAPRPEPLAATARRLIRAALAAGDAPPPAPPPDPAARLHIQLSRGERVLLRQAATGCGMDEAGAARALLLARLDAGRCADTR